MVRKLGLSDPADYADLPKTVVRALNAQNGGLARASWRNSG